MDASVILKPRETVTRSFIGVRRTLSDLNRWEVVFLIIGTSSLLACLGLTVERLDYLSPKKCPHLQNGQLPSDLNNDKKCGADFTFALLVLINCIFCLFHVVHGVVWERPYELYIFAGSILVVTCYCVMDFAVGIEEGLAGYSFDIKLSRLMILLSLGVLDVLLGCWIAARFLREGRFACNLVRTYDAEVQSKCKIHFFTQSLLTFDLEFQVTMVVLILRNGFEFHLSDRELGILIAGLIFAAIWIIIAFVSQLAYKKIAKFVCFQIAVSILILRDWSMLRMESSGLAWFVILSSFLEPAYIIYKMIDSAAVLRNESDSTSLALHYAVFLGGTLGIIIRFILVISLYITTRSFGEHLNERIYGPIAEHPFGKNGNKRYVNEISVN